MDTIIEYLVANGGIWGVLLALAITWILFREKKFYVAEKKEFEKIDLNDSLIKLTSKHDLTHTKIEEIAKAVSDFKEINYKQAKAARALQEKLQEVNDERIDELKEVLKDYNKTMSELSFGIEKMNLILDMKLGD